MFILKNRRPSNWVTERVSCLFSLKTRTDQHFTRHQSTALSLDETNPQNCRRCFSLISGNKKNVDLFWRLAIFSKLLIVFSKSFKASRKRQTFSFLIYKLPNSPPSLLRSVSQSLKLRSEGKKKKPTRSMFLSFWFYFFPSSAVNRTSCDSVLILSCICGVTLLSVKIFWQVPRPGLCDANHNVYKTGSDFCWWNEHQER